MQGGVVRGWLQHSSTRCLAFSISSCRPLLSYCEKSFPFAQVKRVRRRGRRYPRASSLKLFPGNIVEKNGSRFTSRYRPGVRRLCRSWIDSAVICATTDYSLPLPHPFLRLISVSHPRRGRDRRLVTIWSLTGIPMSERPEPIFHNDLRSVVREGIGVTFAVKLKMRLSTSFKSIII